VTGRGARRAGTWAVELETAGVPAPTVAKLCAYLDLLTRFGGALDLTGPVDDSELVAHHVLESLAGAPLLPAAGHLLDLGSGAGFPGVPLLVARPDLRGTLLEPRERRWAFLGEVIRELGLDAEVRRERVREHSGGGYAAVAVRALPAREWGGTVARLLRDDGVLLWWTVLEEEGAVASVRELVHVLSSPLPDRRRGNVTVWRRRST
jgi:16S rRNA (guanine(527)-N(7))-methyltransferase RsmG